MFKKEFEYYPFSKLQLDNKPLFKDVYEFLELSLEKFCKRVELYIYKEHGFDFDNEIGYKYFYTYSSNYDDKNLGLDYHTIEYNGLHSLNKIEVKVYPPKSSPNSESYKGELIIEKNRLILDIKNSKNHIYALFNLELENEDTGYLVGVIIGISSFNQKTPAAKKVVLSKNKIENIQELYLILNETETLRATENINFLNNLTGMKKEDIQLQKLSYKINNINNFLLTSSKSFYKSFYKQLAFKEFGYINEIFSNVVNNKAYYITYRETMLRALLESYEYEKYDSLYIVMPIYTKYSIFNHHSKSIDFIKNKFLELSKKIEIEFIFALNQYDYDISHVKPYLDELSKNAKVYFVLNSNIENSVNSRDFIFSRNKNFVITKELRSLKAAHKFYLSELSHQEYENFYKKIKKYSIEYKEFIKNPKLIKFEKIDPITKRLIGKWHLYFFGTNKRFWDVEVVFKKDKTIEIYNNHILENIGTIIHKHIQSVIIVDNVNTQRTTVATFDNNVHNLDRAFVVSILSKALYSEDDIYTIGVCSKEPIEQEEIEYILLKGENIPCSDYGEIKRRLAKYLVEKL